MDSLKKLEEEIANQNIWEENLQKSFIKDCLYAQGKFKRVSKVNVNTIHQAFKEKALGDESIQYYVRIFLEMVYRRY